MFPLSCAAAQELKCSGAYTVVAAQLEFFSFHCKYYYYYAYYKELLKCRADVRSCKNFLVKAVAGLRICTKNKRERCPQVR
jgi:hypothetical protein